jgi:hypothetical protein
MFISKAFYRYLPIFLNLFKSPLRGLIWIAWQTVYNDLNRCKNGQSILCDTHLGSLSSWTSSMKVKLKRLVNNRKVKLKILQESNNHGSANTKISCKQLKT